MPVRLKYWEYDGEHIRKVPCCIRAYISAGEMDNIQENKQFR